MVSLGTIRKYAPTFYLNAYDNNRPTSVETFLAESSLVDPVGRVIAAEASPEAMAENASADNCLIPANGACPTAENEFESGSVPVGSGTSGLGAVEAPVYVKALDHGAYIDLKYFTFYAWNGFQAFQAGILTGLKTTSYNFTWAEFSRHYGDWEHVTVRITRDHSRIVAVYYSQHQGGRWVTDPPMDGTHPISHVGWNSHANYPTAGVHEIRALLPPPGVPPVMWLKAVDITTNTGTFAVYHRPARFYPDGIIWTPWRNDRHLAQLDHDTQASRWLAFEGRWGPRRRTAIEAPPSLPGSAHIILKNLAKTAQSLGQLDPYIQEDGPLGPSGMNWRAAAELGP